jgi:serine/threonine protein kinase
MGEDFDYSVRWEMIQTKKKLGEGGFGQVYLANDALSKQEVAIKVMNFLLNSGTSNFKLIEKEITALGQLKHKNIVKLHDYFPLPKKQQIIVVMEYLKGGELLGLWKN